VMPDKTAGTGDKNFSHEWLLFCLVHIDSIGDFH
jgi:hypothetical protein